jgi:putative FmdB family regulatory protein
MPNYDYDCLKCGHAFEAFQSMKDEPLKTCPKCKKRSVKRRIGGGAGLIFKGTGFYITDYKNKKPAAEKPAAKPAAEKPAAATKSETN